MTNQPTTTNPVRVAQAAAEAAWQRVLAAPADSAEYDAARKAHLHAWRRVKAARRQAVQS